MSVPTPPQADVAAVVLPPDLEALRRIQLPETVERAYLNAGSLGPLPRVAVAAQQHQLAAEARERQPADMWERLGAAQAAARAAAAQLTGARPEHVCLQHTTHAGINTALWGLQLQPGDRIVTSAEEHPGVLVPLRVARDRCGIEIDIVPWDDDPTAFATAVRDACGASTRAVVVSHVSWATGKVADLALLRQSLPSTARLIVDGAQGAGALPVNAADGWDAYTVSGQKWPCGPNGSGALVLAGPERWQPTFGAFFTTTDPERSLDAPYQLDGRRFEHSQENILPLVGFAAAARLLLDEVGVERAAARSSALNEAARSLLAPVLANRLPAIHGSGAILHGEHHLLSIPVAHETAPHLVQALGARGVVIRNLGPSTLRISLGWWNDLDDLARCSRELDSALAAI